MQNQRIGNQTTQSRRHVAFSVALSALIALFASKSSTISFVLPQDAGYAFPSASGALRDEWTTANHAYANDGHYAQGYPYDQTGNGEEDDEQSFEAFDLVVPSSATISGVELQLKAYSDDDGEDCDLDAKLFWRRDGGWTSFATPYKTWWNLENDPGIKILGGPNDTWGRDSWSPQDFANGAFAIGLRSARSSGCGYGDHVFLDYVAVRVHYSVPPIDRLTPRTSNPALVRRGCNKVDVNFVIDTSASTNAHHDAIINGISAFVDTFEGAGGDGLYSASTFSGDSGQALTSGYVSPSALQDALCGLPSPGGRTPTAAGIAAATSNVGDDRLDAPDVMLVITDGSPNVPPPASEYDPSDPEAWLTAANAAIEAANAARSSGFVVRAAFVGQINEALPWTEQGNADWVAAVMSRIDGSSGGYLEGDYSGLAHQLMSELGCRTVRVRKQVKDPEAPAEVFQGVITNVDSSGQDATWSLEPPDHAYHDFSVPLGAAHTVAEHTPLPTGWALEGYTVLPGLEDCPANGYSGSAATIADGADDVTVCVKNAYDPCIAAETHVDGPSGPCLQAFVYQVCQLGHAGLTHWTLDLPTCTTELTSILTAVQYQLAGTWQAVPPCSEQGTDAGVCYRIGPDLDCGVACGLTWESLDSFATQIKDGACIALSVAFDAQLHTQPVLWAGQAGACPCILATDPVAGPSTAPCCAVPQAAFSASPTSGCAPLSVSFVDESSDATSWHWDFGDGTSSTERNPTHVFLSAGSYTVTLSVSNSCGEDVKTEDAVVAVSNPHVSVSPTTAQLTCRTHSVQLTASASGGVEPYSYQWHRSGSPIPGAISSDLTASQPGGYVATATDGHGCIAGSDAAIVTLRDDPPSVTVVDIDVCAHELPATISTRTDAVRPTYDWVTLPTGCTDPGSVAAFATEVAGQYCVEVTDGDTGCTAGDCGTLTVHRAPQISQHPLDQEVCEGDLAVFSVTAVGADLRYQWQLYDGGPWRAIPGATDSTYAVYAAQQDQDGHQYRVVVTAGTCGSATSDPATLSVDARPVVLAPDVHVCEGYSSEDLHTAIIAGSGGCTVGTPSIIENDDGTYTMSCSNECGTVEQRGTIHSEPNPTVSIADLEIHELPAILIADTSNSACAVTSYQWYTGTSVAEGTSITGATVSTLTVTSAGDYAIQVTCDNGCLAEATASVTTVPTCEAMLQVIKRASTNVAAVGQSVTYTYTVINVGAEPLSEVVAHDDQLGTVQPAPTFLAPGERAVATATYTIHLDDYPGPIINTVVVTASASAVVLTETGRAQVEILAPLDPDSPRIFLPLLFRRVTIGDRDNEILELPYLPVLLRSARQAGRGTCLSGLDRAVDREWSQHLHSQFDPTSLPRRSQAISK